MNTNEQELTSWLSEIFQKPELPAKAELPQQMVEIIEKSGLPNVPQIVFEKELPRGAWGNVDFYKYNETVIHIATHDENLWTRKLEPRTTAQMTRTLAHELGHWSHILEGKNYENSGFKWCEDTADAYRDWLLS